MKKLAVFLLLCATAWAGPVGSVQKVEGATVTFSALGNEGLKVGDRLKVTRNGQEVAEVEIQQVAGGSIKSRVVQVFANEGPVAGDSLIAPTPTGTGGPTASRGANASLNGLSLEAAEQRYRERFERATERHEFRQVPVTSRNMDDTLPGYNAMDIYMAADLLGSSFGPGGFYGDPTLLMMSAYSAIVAKQERDRLYDSVDVQVQIEVTHWDEPLLESYVQYAALSGGQTAPDQYNALRNSIFAQKGVSTNQVFEVRLKNTGQLKAQLSPFHWHIFMAGPNNSRVGATRYDQVLDRQLTSGQEVSGNVYFPKVPGTGKLLVLLEDIYGDRGTLEFSSR